MTPNSEQRYDLALLVLAARWRYEPQVCEAVIPAAAVLGSSVYCCERRRSCIILLLLTPRGAGRHGDRHDSPLCNRPRLNRVLFLVWVGQHSCSAPGALKTPNLHFELFQDVEISLRGRCAFVPRVSSTAIGVFPCSTGDSRCETCLCGDEG